MTVTTHTDSELAAALTNAVKSIWNSNRRDELTVNLVRKTAESSLGLEFGFFAAGDWHQKSRDLVKEVATKLDDEHDNESGEEEETEKEDEAPVKKSLATNKRKADSEDEAKTKRTKKETPKHEDNEDEEQPESNDKDKSAAADAADDAANDSDVSSVIDEPPARMRGSKAKASPKVKAKAPAPKKTSASISADSQEIKKLQQQLGKCGIRKIWGVELKQYGDDDKAKLRYLKNLLRDIGMTGRFSEARAREIKEQRELQADLEAVQKADKTWGTAEDGGRAGRASRRAAPKSLKIEKQKIEGLTDSEDEDNDDDDDDDDDDGSGGSNDDDDDASEGDEEGAESDEESEAEMSDESEDDMPKKKKGGSKKKAPPPKKKTAVPRRGKKAVSSDDKDDMDDDEDDGSE